MARKIVVGGEKGEERREIAASGGKAGVSNGFLEGAPRGHFLGFVGQFRERVTEERFRA
jgi:hypothetical protein